MTKILNILGFLGMLVSSSAFAGASTGGGSGVGLVSPGLLREPGSLLLQVEQFSDQIESSETVKAMINARVLGRIGRSTLVGVSQEGFDQLKETSELPVTDKVTHREYVYSNASETSISLEAVDSEEQVIVIAPTSEAP